MTKILIRILAFVLLMGVVIVTGQDSVKNLALNLHNYYRGLHGAPALDWSTELEKAAQEQANYLASRNLPLAPNNKVDWGQNLFELKSRGRSLETTDDAAIEKALDTWYKGISHYNFENPTSVSRSALSFTQLLWVSTKRVGVGIGRSRENQRIIVVAMYDPHGNLRGEFTSNVLHKAKNGVIKVIPGSSTTETLPITLRSTPSTTRGSVVTPSVTYSPLVPSLIPPSSGTPKENVDSTSAQVIGLELHNEYRRKHGVPALELDPVLSEQAEKYAQAVLSGNRGSQRQTPGLGRNVYQFSGVILSPGEAIKKAVTNWYSHIGEYNWNAPLSSGYYANLFSQLVWKSSTKLGVGVVSGGNKETVIVCYYSPAGNINTDESYKENVFPAQ